jgi:hypothetical protein
MKAHDNYKYQVNGKPVDDDVLKLKIKDRRSEKVRKFLGAGEYFHRYFRRVKLDGKTFYLKCYEDGDLFTDGGYAGLHRLNIDGTVEYTGYIVYVKAGEEK